MSLAQSERVRANSEREMLAKIGVLADARDPIADALAAANRWVDIARPIIVAMLEVAIACEPLWALDHGSAMEARGELGSVQRDLLRIIENVRDEHISAAMPRQPLAANDGAWAAFDAACEPFDEAMREVTTTDDAIRLVTAEMRGDIS